MGFGFGSKKHNRGIKGTGFGNAITPIDKPITGTSGVKGRLVKQ